MATPAPTALPQRLIALASSPALGVALFLLLAGLLLNTRFDYVDDAYYLMLAKSLAGGQGFTDIHLPEPHFHGHFPPGLPLLLSLPALFAPDLATLVVIAKLLLILCGGLGLFLLARLAAREGQAPAVVAAALPLAAVCVVLVGFTTRVASELPYFLLSVAALLTLKQAESSPRGWRWLALSALLLVAALLTRSIGIVLLGAAVLFWALRREFGRALLLVAFSAALWLPWFLLSKAAGAGVGSYAGEFLSSFRVEALDGLLGRIMENGWLVVNRDIPRAILSVSASEFVQARGWLNALLLPARLGISALTLWPILTGLWSRPRLTSIYLSGYLLLIVLWPWDPGRYVVPLVPFFCLSFVAGLIGVYQWLGARRAGLRRPAAAAGVVAVCLASQLVSNARLISTVRRSGHYTPEAAAIWDETMAAYAWIRQHTPPASVVGCEPAIDPHVFLFTGRKALALPARPEAYGRLGITHLLHLTDPTMYPGDEIKRRPDLSKFIRQAGAHLTLRPLYQSDHIAIFEAR